MTLDNMTGITKGSYTGFCKSQLITCNFAKACNGVCPFEDALKHADKRQTMNEQHIINHDRDWIIGCIEHDGFIHTHRFDKANQIILDALQFADRPMGWIPVSEMLPKEDTDVLISYRYKEGEGDTNHVYIDITSYGDMYFGGRKVEGVKHWRQPFEYFESNYEVIAWKPLPEPYKGGEKK